MSRDYFKLTAVVPLSDKRLHLTYADGQLFEIDLKEWITSTQVLRPLKDENLFKQAKLGFGAHSSEWIEDELELAADNLRNLAIEQRGDIGFERIWNWLDETGLSLDQASEALGISRRMLIYYRDGEKTIPRSIWLACLGWEAVRPKGNILPQHIPSAHEYAALHT